MSTYGEKMAKSMQEMMEATSIKITGICRGVNEFVAKSSGVSYWSVDLEVKGTRQPITVKLSDKFPRERLREYELITLDLNVRPGFDRKGIELHAIIPAVI